MASFNLAQAVRDAKAGDTVRVPAGRHEGNLTIDKPLTLLAMGEAVLDGFKQTFVVRVDAGAGAVRLGGFIIVGGSSIDGGAGVALLSGSLELLQCTFRYNSAPLAGGGALAVRGGKALVQQCRFEGNTSRQGGAVMVDALGELSLRDSALIQNVAVQGGGLRVAEGAQATVLGCTFGDNRVLGEQAAGGAVFLSGTTTRTPQLTLSHCVVGERAEGPGCVVNAAAHPGTLTLVKNLLPAWCAALGGDNLFAAAGFTMSGSEPYQLDPRSPAVEAGDPSAFDAAAKDLNGRARLSKGRKPDLGAFALQR